MTDVPHQPDSPQDPPTGPTEPLTAGDPLESGAERPPHEPPPGGGQAPPPGGAGGAGGAHPRRLTRTSGDRLIGGVSGGLGRYFAVDPVLFRIAFVVLAFAGGVGVLAYIGLLAFVPSDGEPAGSAPRRSVSVAGAVVLGIVAVAIVAPPVFVLAPVLVPIGLLILVGVLLWRAVGGGAGDPGRDVARGVLVGAILLAAIGGAIGVAFAAAVGGGEVIAILTIVTGVALVVTAFVGGARWLVLPALVLALPLALVAASGVNLEGGIGERAYRPATLAELRDGYRVGVGELVVDLRNLDLPAGRTDVKVDVGLGEAVVYVPADACVSSDVQIGAGEANVLDRVNDGVDVAFAESGNPDAGDSVVHVDADIGAGELRVRRSRSEFFSGGPFDAQPACP